jgi:hypothetical protein
VQENALVPCTLGKPNRPIGVDPNVVGIWEIPLEHGSWIWEIRRDGTYAFHSEAGDGAPSHSGTFSASNGKWSLRASSGLVGWTDGGTYSAQLPNTWFVTGRLGPGFWHRRPLQAASGKH